MFANFTAYVAQLVSFTSLTSDNNIMVKSTLMMWLFSFCHTCSADVWMLGCVSSVTSHLRWDYTGVYNLNFFMAGEVDFCKLMTLLPDQVTG